MFSARYIYCIMFKMLNWFCLHLLRYQFRSKEEGKPDSRRRMKRSHSFLQQLPKHVYEIDEVKSRLENDQVTLYSI